MYSSTDFFAMILLFLEQLLDRLFWLADAEFLRDLELLSSISAELDGALFGG